MVTITNKSPTKDQQPAYKSPTITDKQKQIIAAYEGNARETAEQLGFNYQYVRDVVSRPYIKPLLRIRDKRSVKPTILNRLKRQEFWSGIIRNTEETTTNRLRASELLGRSQMDFIEARVSLGDNKPQLFDNATVSRLKEVAAIYKKAKRLETQAKLKRKRIESKTVLKEVSADSKTGLKECPSGNPKGLKGKKRTFSQKRAIGEGGKAGSGVEGT